MLEYPIQGFQKNIILTQKNEGMSFYKVSSYTAGLNSQEGLNRLKHLLKNMADQIAKI